MIYGAPGSGKTFVMIDMIFTACLGLQWALRFGITAPLNVAYCAGEGVSGLPARFGAAANHYHVASMPAFTFYAVTPSLFYEDRVKNDIESIERFILEWKQRQDAGQAKPLDLLIIDTLHSATPGANENDAGDMGISIGLCKQATKILGCAVVLVHHSNKAGTGYRGSSALHGAMDCMIEVSRHDGKYLMSCEKLKDGERWKPQPFDLVVSANSVRVWWNEPVDDEFNAKQRASQEIIELLERNPGVKLTAKQIAEPTGMTQAATINALKRLIGRELIKSELYETEKPPSNRNPWVYFVDAE